jgi:uncharacterized protein
VLLPNQRLHLTPRHWHRGRDRVCNRFWLLAITHSFRGAGEPRPLGGDVGPIPEITKGLCMKPQQLVLFGGILLALFAGCGNSGDRFIVVEGRSVVRVPIDYVTISINISSPADNLSRASFKNLAAVNRLLETVHALAIPDSDFQTWNKRASAQPYRYDERRPSSVVYDASLSVRDVRRLDTIYSVLASIPDIDLKIVDFNSSHIDEAQREAYNAAMAAAKKKAEMLLAGTGQSVGAVLKILEDSNNPFQNLEYAQKEFLSGKTVRILRYSDLGPPPSVPVSSFRLRYFDVPAKVTVMYELK